MNRGDVFDVEAPGLGRRPAVIVTRQGAIPYLSNVTVAAITTRVRDLPTEVRLDEAQGLSRESVVNCDNLYTIPKGVLVRYRGRLGLQELAQLDRALRVALELE